MTANKVIAKVLRFKGLRVVIWWFERRRNFPRQKEASRLLPTGPEKALSPGPLSRIP